MMLRKYALYYLCLLALSACAGNLGFPTPTTFNERWAVALAAVTEVRQTATTLLQAKAITPDDAENVLKSTDAARAGLDVARALSKVNATSADAKLDSVRAGLTVLQAYLAAKKGT